MHRRLILATPFGVAKCDMPVGVITSFAPGPLRQVCTRTCIRGIAIKRAVEIYLGNITTMLRLNFRPSGPSYLYSLNLIGHGGSPTPFPMPPNAPSFPG